MIGSARVIQGNALALPLEDESVDLIVTSPPYFGLRSYQDGGQAYDGQIGAEATPTEFVDALIAATAEMVRVLKPSGSIWVNLGDKYASSGGHGISTKPSPLLNPTGKAGEEQRAGIATRIGNPERNTSGVALKSLIGIPWRYAIRAIDDLGLVLRADIIWSKTSGMPESVTDRVRRSHENLFHFTKQARYFAAAEGLRAEGFGRVPGSVWTIAPDSLRVPRHLGVIHTAAYPREIPRRAIGGWSASGMTVLDPFGGTGTTALVAKALGRHGISVDMSADYCRLATWRTTDPGQLASALQVDKPAPVAPDQLDLLEGLLA